MGYYSQYEIYVAPLTSGDEDELQEICEMLEEISGGYSFIPWGEGIIAEESCKWYEHPEDIAELSNRLPGRVVQLRAVGEDGDRWQVFARDGKKYQANLTIEWPDFDPERLA